VGLRIAREQMENERMKIMTILPIIVLSVIFIVVLGMIVSAINYLQNEK